MDPLNSCDQTVGMLSSGATVNSNVNIASAENDPPESEVNRNLGVDQVFSLMVTAPSPLTPSASTGMSNNNSGGGIIQAGSSLLSSPSPSTSTTMRGRSRVWNEFTVSACGKKVICHRCGDSLAYSNSHSTSSMLKHLKRKHTLDLYPPPNATDDDGSGGGGETGTDTTSPSPASSYQSPAHSKKSKSTSSSLEKRPRLVPSRRHVIPPYQQPVVVEQQQQVDTSIQHGPLLFKDPCVRMKWTDHSETFLRTFSTLYSDESYTDVTIVAEKTFFKAHRVILSSASEFFDETFKVTPVGQHPIIFLKDVKATEFRILLDFIYKGEVSIPPGMIPGLVKIGSELRVRGLSDFIWNEHLASSVFQAKSHQPTPEATLQTPWVTGTQSSMASQFLGASGNSNAAMKMTPTAPMRTLIRRPPPQFMGGPSHGGLARTYGRIVNIRPSNNVGVGGGGVGAGGVVNSNGFDGQLITGDLGTVCSTVAGSFPAMKRFRIVTNESRLSPSPVRLGTTGTGSKMGVGGNLGLSTAIGPTAPAVPETVLMVTNQGETMLSTSQGGVTVMSQPQSQMTFPVVEEPEQQRIQPDQQLLEPVITSIISQEQQLTPQQTQEEEEHRGGTESEDLDQVVYSITEICEDGGAGDEQEVLLQASQEDIGCHEVTAQVEEIVDSKPFLQN